MAAHLITDNWQNSNLRLLVVLIDVAGKITVSAVAHLASFADDRIPCYEHNVIKMLSICLVCWLPKSYCGLHIISQEWMRRKSVPQKSSQNTRLRWVIQGGGLTSSQLKVKKTKKTGLKPSKFAAGKQMVRLSESNKFSQNELLQTKFVFLVQTSAHLARKF